MEFNSLDTKSISVFFEVSLRTYQIFPLVSKQNKLQKCTLVFKVPNLPKKWIIITSNNDQSRKKAKLNFPPLTQCLSYRRTGFSLLGGVGGVPNQQPNFCSFTPTYKNLPPPSHQIFIPPNKVHRPPPTPTPPSLNNNIQVMTQ